MLGPDISYIIPTLNEEENLPNSLSNIIKCTPDSLRYEIVVADNGSTDATTAIAHAYQSKLLVNNEVTVGGLRNRAVKMSTGRVLIFLDADVSLTEEWKQNILETYQSLISSTRQITGSKCGIPEKAGWIEQIWFKPLLRKTVNYINSGHLIITREFFNEVGGFDETLDSGEDYAFSQAAKGLNAKIVNNPRLKVVHEGYPKTLLQFVKREIWHGVGEGKALRTILTSNVALVSILFAILHGIVLVNVLLLNNEKLINIGLGGLIAATCFSSAIFKHRVVMLPNVVVVTFLYYIFFSCRFIACIPFLNTRVITDHHR